MQEILEDVAGCATTDRIKYTIVIFKDSLHKHLDLREFFFDLYYRLYPCHPRHFYIHEDNIRLTFPYVFHTIQYMRKGAHHFKLGNSGKQQTDTFPDVLIIIEYGNP